jgi:hypothetical protein
LALNINQSYFSRFTTVTYRSRWGVFDTTLCDKVCQWLATGRCFFLGILVSSTNKNWQPRYNWNIVESGVKHYNPNSYQLHNVWMGMFFALPIYEWIVFSCWGNLWKWLIYFSNPSCTQYTILQCVTHL